MWLLCEGITHSLYPTWYGENPPFWSELAARGRAGSWSPNGVSWTPQPDLAERQRDAGTVLCQNPANDVPVDVGQTEVAAGVAVGQLFVIETQQMQDGCVQIVNVDRGFDGVPAIFVRCSIGHSAFVSSTGQPHGEAEGMMIAAI